MACNLAEKLRQKPAVTVDIRAIDHSDRTFAVSTVKNEEALANSLKFAGLLHAVWLEPYGSKYRIISGFARVRQGLALGWETIAALVLPEDMPPLELAQLAVLDNINARALNPVEEARAVALLKRFAGDEATWRQSLRNLGLSENPKHLAKLEKLLQLPETVQNAVAADMVPLAVADDLAAFNADIALRFTEIFVQGKVGLNRQREFIRLVYELSRIKETDAAGIFTLPEFTAIWQSTESDLRKKALLLLDWLYQTRYPHICAAREQARQKITALGLDNRIRLNMPENFENMRHSLSFSFASQSELTELLDLCREMAANPALKELFKREEV